MYWTKNPSESFKFELKFKFQIVYKITILYPFMGLNCHEIERYILELVNKSREENGLNTLKNNSDLKDIAKNHSSDMANAGHIWHGNGVHLAGGFAGENVALMHSGRVRGFHHEINSSWDVASALHSIWMDSPGHRANILRPGFNLLGVGVVRKGNGYYATQLFKAGGFSFFNTSLIPNFLLWWAVFALGIFLSQLLSTYFNLSNILLKSILAGLIIEGISKTYQIIRFKGYFRVNAEFIGWIIVHSSVFYLILSLIGKFELVYFSLLFTIIIHFIWKLERYNKFKEFISWWLTYFIGLILVSSLFGVVSFNNILLMAFIGGFVIETTSKISQIIRKNSQFNVDKWFLFWILIFSLLYCLVIYIPVVYNIYTILLISLLITVIVYGIWNIDFYHKKTGLWILLLLVLLVAVTNFSYLRNLFV